MENKKVFIGNLDFSVTEGELKNLLLKHGTVVSLKMHQTKGYAFIEMGDAAEASKVIQKMDGIKYKDREMRVSLELKAGKARSVSVKKYKERGQNLSKERSGKDSDTRSRSEKYRDSVKSGYRPSGSSFVKQGGEYRPSGQSQDSEDKSAGESHRERQGLPRPERDRWATEKPSENTKPPRKEWSRDENREGFGSYGRSFEKQRERSEERTAGSGNRPMKDYTKESSGGTSRPPRRERTAEKTTFSDRSSRNSENTGNNRTDRTTRSDERQPKDFTRERSGSDRPAKRVWTAEKPAYSGRPARDGERTSSPRPPRKEWSPDKSSRPSRETGDSWKERPEKRELSGDKPRDYSKPRPVSGSQNRFSKTSRPGSGAGGRKSTTGSSRPVTREGSSGRDRNKQTRRD